MITGWIYILLLVGLALIYGYSVANAQIQYNPYFLVILGFSAIGVYSIGKKLEKLAWKYRD